MSKRSAALLHGHSRRLESGTCVVQCHKSNACVCGLAEALSRLPAKSAMLHEAVVFHPSDWIEGEIRTCYSILFNGEFFGIDCSSETQETKRDGIFRYSPENHVLLVRFWGSLKPDANKLWKCERFQTTMTCQLQ
jgi:hypothetical protein